MLKLPVKTETSILSTLAASMMLTVSTIAMFISWGMILSALLLADSPQDGAGGAEDIFFIAPRCFITPQIDGQIEDAEWRDAQKYLHLGADSNIDLFFKSGLYHDKDTLFIGVKLWHGITISEQCNNYRNLTLYFDEGNDGSRGSGSFDGVFTRGQEDSKKLSQDLYHGNEAFPCKEIFGYTEGCPEPACSPTQQNECWKCPSDWDVFPNFCYWTNDSSLRTPSIAGTRTDYIDGYYGLNPITSWIYQGKDALFPTVDGQAYSHLSESGEYSEFEFAIPLMGTEVSVPQHPWQDLSDLTIQFGDTIAFGFFYSFSQSQPRTPNSECIGFWSEGVYPTGFDLLDASTFKGKIQISSEYLETTFQRGNADATGIVDLTDATFLLEYLFLAGPVPPCRDAADVNDDGHIDLADPVALLQYMYSGGDAPPSPGPAIEGFDPTADALDCQSFFP
jgi:hypothetical protein